MIANCQECKQPLLLQQTQASLLKESYDNLDDLLKQTKTHELAQNGLPTLDDH
jgi:hypothetical protein